MINSGRIAQHRNYGELMARHERDLRFKRVIRIFVYFLIAAFVIIIYFMVREWQPKQKPATPQESPAAMIYHPKTPSL